VEKPTYQCVTEPTPLATMELLTVPEIPLLSTETTSHVKLIHMVVDYTTRKLQLQLIITAPLSVQRTTDFWLKTQQSSHPMTKLAKTVWVSVVELTSLSVMEPINQATMDAFNAGEILFYSTKTPLHATMCTTTRLTTL